MEVRENLDRVLLLVGSCICVSDTNVDDDGRACLPKVTVEREDLLVGLWRSRRCLFGSWSCLCMSSDGFRGEVGVQQADWLARKKFIISL